MENKSFIKKCPSCGNPQKYTTKYRMMCSIKENWVCNNCSITHQKKIYEESIIKTIIDLYSNNMSLSKIASTLKISKRNTKKILIEKNLWIEDRDKIKIAFSENEITDIIKKYTDGLSLDKISKIYGISKNPIAKILRDRNILRKNNSNGKKIYLSNIELEKIKFLYLNEFQTTKQIAKKLKLNQHFVDKIIQNSGYRRTKGQSISLRQKGKKRTEVVRQKIKNGLRNFVQSGKRKQTGGICKEYTVNGIKCQGTYEKFYIEKLLNEKKEIPMNCGPIKTPYGLYYPDFLYRDTFIEIKSDYTYEIMLGNLMNRFTKKFDDTQFKKIKWVNENIKPIEIFVVDKKNNKIEKKLIG